MACESQVFTSAPHVAWYRVILDSDHTVRWHKVSVEQDCLHSSSVRGTTWRRRRRNSGGRNNHLFPWMSMVTGSSSSVSSSPSECSTVVLQNQNTLTRRPVSPSCCHRYSLKTIDTWLKTSQNFLLFDEKNWSEQNLFNMQLHSCFLSAVWVLI